MTSPSPVNRECVLDPETHEYFANGERVPLFVTKVLSLAGIVQPYPKQAQSRVEHRREIGVRTHAWAEHLDTVKKPKVHLLEGAEILPYVLGYQKFRAKHKPSWLYIEESFERGGCAGTPDRIGTIFENGDQVPCILDIKTAARPAVYWPIQLTAYQWLTEHNECNLYVVWLSEDGTFKLLNYSSNREVWIAALTVARWQMIGRR